MCAARRKALPPSSAERFLAALSPESEGPSFLRSKIADGSTFPGQALTARHGHEDDKAGLWSGGAWQPRLPRLSMKRREPPRQRTILPRIWRAMFPALDQRVGGKQLVYLDSAATTQRALPVLDEIMDFYRRDNANPGGALHELARRANERYERARRTLATFINAATPAEVVWTRGTTEGINLVATAWGRSHLRRGDEVLLTIAEHASNLLPWRLAAEATGARVRFVEVDDEGRISLDDLDRKLSERTRLVAFSHVSNVAGYINPAADDLRPGTSSWCARVRRRRAVGTSRPARCAGDGL